MLSEPARGSDISSLACRALYRGVCGPGTPAARGWWGAAPVPTARLLERLVTAYVAPHAVREQLAHLQQRAGEIEDAEVRHHCVTHCAGPARPPRAGEGRRAYPPRACRTAPLITTYSCTTDPYRVVVERGDVRVQRGGAPHRAASVAGTLTPAGGAATIGAAHPGARRQHPLGGAVPVLPGASYLAER